MAIKWRYCDTQHTLLLSHSDENWQQCAARAASNDGEIGCSRRRGNFMWPRNYDHMPDENVSWHPCKCCTGGTAILFHRENKTGFEATWNVVYQNNCSQGVSSYETGTVRKEPANCAEGLDRHPNGSAICDFHGQGCFSQVSDRWTCCHEFFYAEQSTSHLQMAPLRWGKCMREDISVLSRGVRNWQECALLAMGD